MTFEQSIEQNQRKALRFVLSKMPGHKLALLVDSVRNQTFKGMSYQFPVEVQNSTEQEMLERANMFIFSVPSSPKNTEILLKLLETENEKRVQRIAA